jgi:hypothetical protein
MVEVTGHRMRCVVTSHDALLLNVGTPGVDDTIPG